MGSEKRGKSLQAFCAESGRGELLREWDTEKNGGKTPSDVSMGSHQKVWWVCPKGHSYCSEVKSRTQGTGCPICAGRVILSDENSLAAKYPALVAEWDAEKNAPLLPTQVAPGTQRKAWWLCPKGHSYYSSIASRAGGSTGCPVCAGQVVIPSENDLASQYPQLAAQWDRKKNGKLKPEMVTPKSNRRVWWRCEKRHSFCSVIAHRVKAQSGCPYCAGQKVLAGFNDLATREPVVASQWHPTLNGDLTPEQVTAGSSRRVWWLCEKGHAWHSAVSTRTGKQRCGCPVCAGRPQSQCTVILNGYSAKPPKGGDAKL